jgi:hypothetical protein
MDQMFSEASAFNVKLGHQQVEFCTGNGKWSMPLLRRIAHLKPCLTPMGLALLPLVSNPVLQRQKFQRGRVELECVQLDQCATNVF